MAIASGKGNEILQPLAILVSRGFFRWKLRSRCVVIEIRSSPQADDIKLEEILRLSPMPKDPPAILKSVSVNLPFGMGGATWEADPTEQNAAWELYIELVTRIAVQSLDAEQGTVREALSSLYTLFGTTRDILRKAGPKVGASRESVGGIAIAVLNQGLRPFMSAWHPRLQAWEAQNTGGLSPQQQEKAWAEEPTIRAELEKLRQELATYAHALAVISGVEE